MMRTGRIVLGVLVSALVIVGGNACGGGGGENDASRPADDLDIDIGRDVPDDFPVDVVPLPDGAVASGSSIGNSAQRSWTIVYDVDDVRAAAAGYRTALEAAGFTVDASLTTEDEDGELASFTAAGANFVVTAFAGGVRGEATLTVTVAPAAAG